VEYLTRDPIDVVGLMAAVGDSGCGGTVVFLGSVRRAPEDGPVIAIDYDAYEEMAAAELGRIVEEAKVQWPGAGLSAQHRLGRVPLGEPSIAVVVAAPHRTEAFAACRWVIDEAKRRLPVWKKERFDDGAVRWREQ
jgi:molybdopterin synthase catalytic subunit